MKKVLTICLMMVLVMSLTMTAFAAPNGFVSSPSEDAAPKLVSFTPSDDECTARLVITPYGERETLPDALEAMMENARNQIVGSTDLTKLNADLAALAAKLKIKGEDLAVSDLFDIHVTGCNYHDGHTDFDIVLSADMLKHFVGLLHMQKDGSWELVSDAKVTGNGEHLAFSVESFSPFAIVVETSGQGAEIPKTGDDNMFYVYAAIMAVSAVALVVIAVVTCKKKQKA